MTKLIKLYGGDVTLEFDERLHAYRWREKDLLVSGVTKIIGILDKPALVQWAANMACDYIGAAMLVDGGARVLGRLEIETLLKEAKTAHRRTSKEATDIGKEVHAFAERALVDRRVTWPTDPKAKKGAEAFMSWLHATNIEPIAVERMLFSRHWYYAGTTDFYGFIDGERCVMDLKTSSGLYPEMLLQLAAYAIAIEEETHEDIADGWIVRLCKKTGKCEPYHINITQGLKDAFLRVRETHEALQKVEALTEEVRTNGISKQAA